MAIHEDKIPSWKFLKTLKIDDTAEHIRSLTPMAAPADKSPQGAEAIATAFENKDESYSKTNDIEFCSVGLFHCRHGMLKFTTFRVDV